MASGEDSWTLSELFSKLCSVLDPVETESRVKRCIYWRESRTILWRSVATPVDEKSVGSCTAVVLFESLGEHSEPEQTLEVFRRIHLCHHAEYR